MRGPQSLAGRFELGDAVDAGGVGTIHRAIDRETGALVAAKIVVADDALDVERFAREADALRTLSHPGIVRYIDRGVSDDGHQFLIMEWIEGENLAHRLDAEGLTIRESVDVVGQVADALAEAHRHGMIHRDIKPANIMLDGHALDRARVVDFGLARFLADEHKLTHTGLTMGTPGYMSPEQARGSRSLDGRVDVFALGCVLYECLAGFAPFQGENVVALQLKVLMIDPRPLAEVAAGIPAPLAALVERMLAKQSADRPDMVEVAAALRGMHALPDRERRRGGGAAPGTRKLGTIAPEPSAPGTWLVMAAPRRPADDWPARARAAAAEWPHEVTRDHTLVVRHADASEAAHAALALAGALPDAVLVIAGPTGGDLETSIDRSTRVLSVAALRAVFARGGGAGRVHLDPETARLLPPRFEVTADGDDLVLRGVRT